MEERRLLIAVALSLIVLTAYQMLVPQRPVQRGGPSPSPPSSTPTASESEPSAGRSPTPAPPPEPAVAVRPIADAEERRVEIRGPEASMAFTNRGARLVSWRLAHFKDARGRPEEMVQNLLEGPHPLDIETGDPDLDSRLRDALFRPSRDVVRLAPGRRESLRFEYGEGSVEAWKELGFRDSGYLVSVKASVVREGKAVPCRLVWGPGVGNPTAAEEEVQGYQPPQGVALTASGVQRVPSKKLETAQVLREVRWVGVESQYFAALFVPPAGSGSAEIRRVPLPGAEGEKRFGPVAALQLHDGGTETLLYVGPKDYATLSRLGHGLREVVPVGAWIGPIVVAFMRLLSWLEGLIGNYGWSIVALTVLINLVMAPLRHYGIVNGMKMAKLGPEMRVIQDRYRKVPALDPKRQEMQKEISALYARHGMSMGTQMTMGCLPILLTMPFLFAIYQVLKISIDLRGASFLWIPDLSHKDPIFLTPLLMGASMLLMQRITPTTADPAQQRIMTLMPIVFMVMFFAAPAGLNLYWLSSNACSIVQQGVTRSLVHGPAKESGEARKGKRRR
jgi:YidC/Oxa1 family membrane protein insertase